MLQKSPVLTPSLENLSYILRHREFWPDKFEWNYRYQSTCAIGLCELLWHCRPDLLHPGLMEGELTYEPSMDYHRIFASRHGKVSWLKCWPWNYHSQMCSITPEQVADCIDRFLLSHGSSTASR